MCILGSLADYDFHGLYNVYKRQTPSQGPAFSTDIEFSLQNIDNLALCSGVGR